MNHYFLNVSKILLFDWIWDLIIILVYATSGTLWQTPPKNLKSYLHVIAIFFKLVCDLIRSLFCVVWNDVAIVFSTFIIRFSRYNDCPRAGRSGHWIPVEARFSAPVKTGPEAHPASGTMGTRSFPGVRCCWSVMLTPHPLLVPRSKIE
jgi:hypothetical protein